MQNNMKKIIYALLLLVTVYSCQDNLIDGGVNSANVNKTTVEYLRSNAKFDTVMILFEKAGLLDQLNKPNTTVIVPTDYSVNLYIQQIQAQKRRELDDENLKYTFKDLINDFDLFKDSLKMYVVPQRITRTELAAATGGLIETKSLLGNNVEISLLATKLYTEWLPNSDVKLIHYKSVINGLDPVDINSVPAEDQDVDNICQTTGILTTTGVLHVLEDTHSLFFNKRKLQQ
jgi:hypothetical protein